MIDDADLRILRELQGNSALGLEAVGEAVGMSTTSCFRRLKKMESEGVILGRRLVLDEKKLGLEVTAIFRVVLDTDSMDIDQRMAKILRTRPEVTNCYLLSGDSDFILVTKFPDAQAYTDYIYKFLEIFSDIPVKTYTSELVVRKIKETSDLPI